MTPREEAEQLLRLLKDSQRCLSVVTSKAEEEIARIRAGYGPDMEGYRKDIEQREKELKTLAKKHRGDLFDGDDKVTLENGILLYTKGSKVRIPKGALERIKTWIASGMEGFKEGIKTVESVNRPVVEKWPDEKLAVIGAEKKQVESFSYELK